MLFCEMRDRPMKKILTIAGSDPGGGAGIQADIKTITVHGMYACSVITSLTAQNTTGVYGIDNVAPQFVSAQMDCVFSDIYPDAVKIGMTADEAILERIISGLKRYRPGNVVIDPVMISTSGRRLLSESALTLLKGELLPMGTLITPNLPEAQTLTGLPVRTQEDMEKAARLLFDAVGTAVLIKGGHLPGDAEDILYDGRKTVRFSSPRIDNPNTHGTGCTLSSAIACRLAEGKSLTQSVKEAKDYLTGAIRAHLDLGKGSGPLNHMYALSLPEPDSL